MAPPAAPLASLRRFLQDVARAAPRCSARSRSCCSELKLVAEGLRPPSIEKSIHCAMPPGPTFDPEAPPTKQTVTDSDGNPTCGSDKFHFMVFLEVAEDAMPTADKEFNELVTYGYISSI